MKRCKKAMKMHKPIQTFCLAIYRTIKQTKTCMHASDRDPAERSRCTAGVAS